MKIYLNRQLVQDSPILNALLNYLQKKEYVKITSEETQDKTSSIVLSISQGSEKLSNEDIISIVLIDNMRNKLMDDYFTHYIKLPKDDKKLQSIRDVYDAYVSANMLNKRYNLQLGFEPFTKNAQEKNPEGINILDSFDQYLEFKKEHIIKLVSSLKFKNAQVSNLNDVINRIKEAKEMKKKLKARIAYEQFKNEIYLKSIREKFDTVCYSLTNMGDFRTYSELENESVDVEYQGKIIQNLRLYRQAIEKKMMADLYTKDQIAALEVIQELIQKKLNLLRTDKAYVQEKLEKQRRYKDDPKMAQVIAEIFETSRAIKKREKDLAKLKQSSAY